MNSILGLEKEAYKKWQKRAEDLFWIWASSKDADWTSIDDFWLLQKLVFRSFLESGEAFVLKRFDKDKSKPFGLSLQLIEADRISSPNRLDTKKIIGGIEKNERGQVVKYHICSSNPFDYTSFETLKWESVEASEMLHIYDRTRPDQTHGVPFLAPAIEPLKQLSRFTEAELTAAVVTAMFAIFIKTESKSGPAFAGGLPGAVKDSLGMPKCVDVTRFKSGAAVNLSPGESIEVADPKRPNAAFDPFFKAMVREVGISLQIPYEILMKHYESSYTAARASMLDAWKTWESFRTLLTQRFCNPVWQWFLDESIARGYISAPGYLENPLIKRAYSFVQWNGPAMGALNPAVEAQAEKAWFDMGAKTMEQIATEKFGNDFEEVVDQQEHERARLITLPILANGAIVSTPVDPKKLDEE
jgi:lambda family phage portal protein